MTRPRTLFDSLWEIHEVVRRDDGASLLWVDRHLVHEGSHHAFRRLGERDLPVTQSVPDPAKADAARAGHIRDALDDMGLEPGRPLAGAPVDQAFIGSSTNGRI